MASRNDGLGYIFCLKASSRTLSCCWLNVVLCLFLYMTIVSAIFDWSMAVGARVNLSTVLLLPDGAIRVICVAAALRFTAAAA